MIDMYLEWPLQARNTIENWGKYRVSGDFNEVAIVGMGGSGIVGDYIQVLSASTGSLPVYVVKSHLLPGFIDEKTLLIAVSYSGNTLETLFAVENAISRGLKPIIVSSGGLLRSKAEKHGLLYIPLPQGLLPRVSLPSMLYSILGLLDSSGYSVVTKNEARDSVILMERVINSGLSVVDELTKLLYRGLSENRLVIIATHTPLEALASRGKNEFNENSKIIVKVDVAPEWMHNDIVGYEAPVSSKYSVVEIVDPGDSVGVKLVKFMDEVYRQHDSETYTLYLNGETLLEKLLYGSLVLGLVSAKLAALRGIDPAETRSIVQYKKQAYTIFGIENK
jgi:glucose/mannose-6-phosphate isomerase